MAMSTRNSVLLCLIVLIFTLGAVQKLVQAENAPIYLDEPEPEPSTRVVRRQVLKEVNSDKSPRAERTIVRMSDDRIVNDGKYIEFYRGGQKYVEGTYKMGVFEGEWQYWYPNGQSCKKVLFKNGLADGQWEVLDKDGKLVAKKSYQDGKRHGDWINYFEGGEQARLQRTYDLGLLASQRLNYENGQKRQVMNFKEGKMDGQVTWWEENGKKSAEAFFNQGKIVGEVQRFGNQ